MVAGFSEKYTPNSGGTFGLNRYKGVQNSDNIFCSNYIENSAKFPSCVVTSIQEELLMELVSLPPIMGQVGTNDLTTGHGAIFSNIYGNLYL